MRNFSLLSLYKQTNRCFSTLCVPTQADFYLGIFPRRTEQSVHPPTWFGGAEGKDKLSLFPLSPLSTTYLMARTTRTFNETNPNLLNLQLAPARNSHSHANLVKNGTHTQQPNQTDKIDQMEKQTQHETTRIEGRKHHESFFYYFIFFIHFSRKRRASFFMGISFQW